MTFAQGHTLVVYRAGERADATLRRLAELARERDGRLTVVALAVEEPASRGCCDTRSVLWNRIARELAREQLAQARAALAENAAEVELAVLAHSGRRVADTLVTEARRREADEIVLADPSSCGLSRRERRRLDALGEDGLERDADQLQAPGQPV
jgi:nucleotide-binding universal stress UspA family protein